MHDIKQLELHVTHACNFTCEGCSHYSNHGHFGNISLDDIDFRPLNLFWTGPSFNYNFSKNKNSKIKNLFKKIQQIH